MEIEKEAEILVTVPGMKPFVAPAANERLIREMYYNPLTPEEQLLCKFEVHDGKPQESDSDKIFRQLMAQKFEEASQKGKKYKLKSDRNSDLLLNTFEITKSTKKEITYKGKNGKGEEVTETATREDFKEILKNFISA